MLALPSDCSHVVQALTHLSSAQLVDSLDSSGGTVAELVAEVSGYLDAILGLGDGHEVISSRALSRMIRLTLASSKPSRAWR
jgi:hypothetical protein